MVCGWLQQLLHLSGQCTGDGVRPSPVAKVFESDAALDEQLRREVLEALKSLEDVPEHTKDRQNWPGCDNKVRNV